nr:integrase, catalytic region, zinc finger, CCHC-type, peptidase aspartic, catalytic [Tanacetum cinerariifolium]
MSVSVILLLHLDARICYTMSSPKNTAGTFYVFLEREKARKRELCENETVCKRNPEIEGMKIVGRNIKNIVRAQPRKVNKKNSVVEPIHDVDVKHSLLNENYEPICSTCKKSMFDGVHDKCLLDFVENVSCPDCSLVSGLRMFKTYDMEPLLAHELCFKLLEILDVTFFDLLLKPMMVMYLSFLKVLLLGAVFLTTIVKISFLGGTAVVEVILVKEDVFPSIVKGSNVSAAPSSSRVHFRSFKLSFGTWTQVASRSQETNLYTLSIGDMVASSPICLLSKASKKKSWLWHRRLSHLNFGAINNLAKNGLVRGPELQSMTPATSSSRLVSNHILQKPCNPPLRDDWDHLFQPMFDEYFNPPTIAVSPILVVATPRAINLVDSPVSTSIDQDATSTTNVIGDPSRSVSTRKQLQTDAIWCYLDAFLTSVELKNFKQAMTEPSWIDAMQEEIHKFERLHVWESS